VSAGKSRIAFAFFLEWPVNSADASSMDRFSAMAMTILAAFQNQLVIHVTPTRTKKSGDASLMAMQIQVDSKATTDNDIQPGFPDKLWVGGLGSGSRKCEFAVHAYPGDYDAWAIAAPSYVRKVPALIGALVAEKGSSTVMHSWNVVAGKPLLADAATICVRLPVPDRKKTHARTRK